MKTNKPFQLNIPISKIDEDQRIVVGIATDETLDSQGDIVDYEASKKAFSEWKGNIREMHGDTAIGKAIDVQFDDKAKSVTVSAKISESADGENAWIKVKEEILSGFSIGGRVFEVAKDKAIEGATRVLDYALSELSLVDNPANPSAELLMVKSVDGNKLQRVEEDKSEQLMPTSWWATKFMGAPMKKSVYDAQEALGIAAQLTWLIMTEEPDQQTDLVAAFNALRDFAAKEVAEGDDFDWTKEYNDVIELAQNAINLRKGKQMADKKVKKTNVVGGEERNLDAEVTETAEQAGRPVNDTTERAAEAGVPAVGEVVTDEKGKPVVDEDGKVVVQDREYADDDKTKTPDDTARNDITPPQDKKVVDDKEIEEPVNEQTIDSDEQTVNDTKEDRSPAIAVPANPDKPAEDKGKEEEKKSDTATDLLKNVQSLLTKLNDDKSGESLKKVSDAFEKLNDKVEKSFSALEDRIKAIEDQPVATKGKRYQVVGKGDSEEADPELAEIQKRQDYLTEHPMEAKPGEAEAIHKALRKAQTAERITIS